MITLKSGSGMGPVRVNHLGVYEAGRAASILHCTEPPGSNDISLDRLNESSSPHPPGLRWPGGGHKASESPQRRQRRLSECLRLWPLPSGGFMDIHSLLKMVIDRKASDLHLKVKSPPQRRRSGRV